MSTRKRKSFSGSSLSSISGCSNTCGVAKKTGSRISDVSLGPRGAMSIRLETHYDHLTQRPNVHYIGGVVLIWELWLAIVQHVMQICVLIVTKCSIKTKISHSQKSHLLISLTNKNCFVTHTLSNPYCKLTIYAILPFIIIIEFWYMSADVAIVSVFHLYFTSIFANFSCTTPIWIISLGIYISWGVLMIEMTSKYLFIAIYLLLG